jgi:hypothetical protein
MANAQNIRALPDPARKLCPNMQCVSWHSIATAFTKTPCWCFLLEFLLQCRKNVYGIYQSTSIHILNSGKTSSSTCEV